MFIDYYQILEIYLGASDVEIKKAFKIQAKKWHPDLNRGIDTNARMQLINEAYIILSDNDARRKYDKEFEDFLRSKNVHNYSKSPKNDFEYEEYNIQDDELLKWMRNARKQAVDLAKQTIKDFKDIGIVGAKAATKGAGNQLVAQILISIVIIAIFGIIGKCH